MRLFLKLVLITALTLFVFISCSNNNNGPAKNKFRLVYYPSSVANGAGEEEQGLNRVNISDLSTGREAIQPVSYTTGVGFNGVIVFEYENAENRLWAKCESGSLVQVPFPEPLEGYNIIHLTDYPKINLAPDGHSVIYFVENYIDDNQPFEDASVELIKFSCSTGEMTRFSMNDFITKTFAGTGANTGRPDSYFTIINKDATKAWFVLKGIKSFKGNLLDVKYCIIQWTEGKGFEAKSELLDFPLQLMGMDYLNEEIVVTVTDTNNFVFVETFEQSGAFSFSALKPFQLSNPNQMALNESKMVVFSGYGIEMVLTDNGNVLNSVASWNELDPADVYNHSANNRISMSRDGKVIVYALQSKDDPELYSLYMINSDGTERTLLAKDRHMGIPVISSEMVEQ